MSTQPALFDQGSVQGIAIGAPVRWTKTTHYRTSISMVVHDGTLVGTEGSNGIVKLRSGKKTRVPLALLHAPDQQTDLDKVMNKMRGKT